MLYNENKETSKKVQFKYRLQAVAAVEDSCVGVWWWRLWRDGECQELQLIGENYILN